LLGKYLPCGDATVSEYVTQDLSLHVPWLLSKCLKCYKYYKSANTEGSKKMYSLFDSQHFGTKRHVVKILERRERESLYVFEVTTISG
jgi:hypothetical protein